MSEQSDITKAVMSEGAWHLVPAEYVINWAGFDRSSVIVHACEEIPEISGVRPGQALTYYPSKTYWSRPEALKTPCSLCSQRPPEAIAGLFMLHNFDDFAGEGLMDRFITEAVKKAHHDFESEFFLQGDGFLK